MYNQQDLAELATEVLDLEGKDDEESRLVRFNNLGMLGEAGFTRADLTWLAGLDRTAVSAAR